MVSVLENKKCCGCSACADICPTNAITMVPDREGFLYPSVDENKCTNCGLCEKVCPAIELPEFNEEPDVYGLQLNDKEALNRSQSGGAFWAIAEEVLLNGGVVYGAAFDDDLRVVHKRAESIEEAKAFHGSKYVQTDMRDIMPLVKKDLIAGKQVLFTGTACHIAGLYKFLGKDYENLITCDLICHGVPTPMLLEKYLEYIEKKVSKKVKEFYFGYYRADDGYTWNHPRTEGIFFNNKDFLQENKYIRMFASNWCLRPYCHTCPFTKTERISDFTIGDFWGVEKYTDKFDTEYGVSVIFLNSDKAKKLLPKLKSKALLEVADIDDVKRHQVNLTQPTTPNKRRGLIIEKLINNGFKSAYMTNNFYHCLYCIKQKVLKH